MLGGKGRSPRRLGLENLYFGTISQNRGHLIEGDCFIGSHNANLGY